MDLSFSFKKKFGVTMMQVPTSNFSDLFDVSGDGYDFFVGLQETPNFDAKTSISEVLGDKYR